MKKERKIREATYYPRTWPYKPRITRNIIEADQLAVFEVWRQVLIKCGSGGFMGKHLARMIRANRPHHQPFWAVLHVNNAAYSIRSARLSVRARTKL